MLPTSSSKGRASSSSSSSRPNPMLLPYLRRIIKWRQMDIEYTFWQMLHLCTSPKVVYQHTKYHKQTKNQWARDDPAFVVICSLLVAIATLAYCAAYDHSSAHAIFVVFSVLLFHFFLTGLFLATFCWFLTNAYLREEAPNSYVVEQRVECDPLFSVSSIGGSWLHSSFAVKSTVHGGRIILSLSKFFRLRCSALFGEDHLFPLPDWCCNCPISHFDFEWLQSF
ncbi:protein unc-50 homolog isoform X2 [Arachis ipaensis]|uniref:protein unc-50 homolog isoform X2 n=1 Tax=Arachis ipaensis TaxID=130454 RepID=UPI000A2B187B|nr:protein unc-50 homolog isoform X2 [Arachis ipaensis]XP_025675044.1 protein unc-50 homolog isoform X2 [Arachis hypogaea]